MSTTSAPSASPSPVIAEWDGLRRELGEIYDSVQQHKGGELAVYIPHLAKVDPELFGVAVCTVDGQMLQLGDATADFCVQSCAKPINYCLALEEHGETQVHRYVGREPSGRGFNELTLDYQNKPHNPMINSGAIVTCALLRADLPLAERFEHVVGAWRRAGGGAKPGFSNATYVSEKQTADRNFALGYFMREKGCFPAGTNMIEALEFYFQCCSIESNAANMSVVAATLAAGGVCPITQERVFARETVRDCLSLMFSCGLYDFSGEFAFAIGLPAKSGVSGALMLVVPNLFGICIYSPRLDAMGNSVRGVEFARQLVARFSVHNFDGLLGAGAGKRDPRAPTRGKT
jgi:glutaminase